MVDSIDWLQTFIVNYPALQYIVIFLGAGFGGEAGVIILAFLSAQKIFPFFPFFLVSFLAMIVTDTFWFLLGRTKTVNKALDHRYATYTVFVIAQAVHKMSRGSNLFALILIKFIIGTRVVLIFYFSRAGMTLKYFLTHNFIAIFIWLVVVIPIGFFAGLGFTYISNILENIYAGIGFLLLIALLIIVAQIYLKKFITKEGQEAFEEGNVL
ncbi:hypothetical protein COU49_02120 [Candidatus Nomurabacteria bacterium CG10_big_fil_rev_8_21_14_0_10_35_16]|uniref:DedA family protein n=1 Tax=Candidatus Nomurabacteria bacterium CG10_big_fil_rev_8_21_14_0_10_35_16 TaxID=1974731 RepID=A0A2H0TB87_9BACT|nr:MAG: hypothetical protein COU49_02120 [Candidatus Nomurabacteria bacterium CG10_big_fil_rev_8_21_14_0_10_35_16]